MALHEHTLRLRDLHEKLAYATALGEKKIPAAMTWPVAQIKSALRHSAEALDDAKQMLLDQHTEGKWIPKDPAKPEGPKKFIPDPVYQLNEDGSRKLKTDAAGKETDEPLINQGRIQLTNAIAHSREERELLAGTVTIRVPHISWPQLEGKVAALESNIVEGLMEFFDDPPKNDAKPEATAKGTKKAAVAT